MYSLCNVRFTLSLAATCHKGILLEDNSLQAVFISHIAINKGMMNGIDTLQPWKCIIVTFQLAHDFTHLASQWLFLCATCLNSEPLHFASKSVEFLHASLYHWSFKNKLTLDLSCYIWKSLVGDTSCCNFFLIVNCT